MSIIVDKVDVVNPQGKFTDDFIFDITIECTSPISTFIKLEVIYVGSTQQGSEYEQILASKKIGPIEVGLSRFVIKAKPPQVSKIPFEEAALAGLTVRALYKDQEFNKILYFVSNEIPATATSFDGLDLSTIDREVDDENKTVHPKQINWK
ncbi:chromatin assembly or disassembly [Trichomonas vaginalis G3]|uniref:chromatin assembly or disassembly n=1 Tax=Trichomonas vaginalis (strain ATCC PRA-98 / G3) TaxID=412133 RepID=UPI0021E52E53|nr:chromatin assembly or disassembly [Trichomonas vaginalis G3]KAI5502634.1 chromatin assembly or disassembly [Trichomonas vaginalis G3]